MSSIINKILGKDHEHEHSHSHSNKTEVKCEGGSCSTTATGGEKCGNKKECAQGESCETRTVQRDGVNIKSTISTEGSSKLSLANQQKLTDLVSKLGSTHSQIDEYAKSQTEKINEDIQHEINDVVARTRREQEELLRQANEHTTEIDNEYRARLQLMVEEIDAAKAKRISEIETELNARQAGILQAARTDIDTLNKKAAQLKIGVLEAAEAKVAADARDIAANATLDKATALHQATGKTTIKTEVSAAATTTAASAGTTATTGTASAAQTQHAANASAAKTQNTAGGATHVTETKTVETAKHQSH